MVWSQYSTLGVFWVWGFFGASSFLLLALYDNICVLSGKKKKKRYHCSATNPHNEKLLADPKSAGNSRLNWTGSHSLAFQTKSGLCSCLKGFEGSEFQIYFALLSFFHRCFDPFGRRGRSRQRPRLGMKELLTWNRGISASNPNWP